MYETKAIQMDDKNQDKPKQDDERLPYEPPAVVSEEVFETLALSCASANPFVCGGMPSS